MWLPFKEQQLHLWPELQNKTSKFVALADTRSAIMPGEKAIFQRNSVYFLPHTFQLLANWPKQMSQVS